MKVKNVITSAGAIAFALSFAVAGAASALTTSCAGAPTSTNITWMASSSGGIAPVSFLWGNGSTSPSQTIAELPGVYSMTLQATDASSSIATTTCSATVAQSAPTVTSFTGSPVAITAGQSAVLSWVVVNASSTSIDNGVGTVTGTSVTVTPSVTTTYHLSAVNPVGTTNATFAIVVNAATSTGTGISAQIQNLLNQIAALKAQILQLLSQKDQGSGNSGGTATTTPPVACSNLTRDLSEGDRGSDVTALQQTLSSDPSILPPGLITGFFGHRTQEALKKFQQKFGIFSVGSTTTGFFGPKTRGALRSECESEGASEHSTIISTATSTSNEGHGNSGKSDKNGKGESHDN